MENNSATNGAAEPDAIVLLTSEPCGKASETSLEMDPPTTPLDDSRHHPLKGQASEIPLPGKTSSDVAECLVSETLTTNANRKQRKRRTRYRKKKNASSNAEQNASPLDASYVPRSTCPENEEVEEEALMNDNQLLTTNNNVDVVDNGKKFEEDENANAIVSQESQSQLEMKTEGMISEGKEEEFVQELEDQQPPKEAHEGDGYDDQEFSEDVVNVITPTSESDGIPNPDCFKEAIQEELQTVEQLIKLDFDCDDYEFSKAVIQAYASTLLEPESSNLDGSESKESASLSPQDINTNAVTSQEAQLEMETEGMITEGKEEEREELEDEQSPVEARGGDGYDEQEFYEEVVNAIAASQLSESVEGAKNDEEKVPEELEEQVAQEKDEEKVLEELDEQLAQDKDEEKVPEGLEEEQLTQEQDEEKVPEGLEEQLAQEKDEEKVPEELDEKLAQEKDEEKVLEELKQQLVQDEAEEVSTGNCNDIVDVKTCSDEATILLSPVETEKIEQNVLIPPQPQSNVEQNVSPLDASYIPRSTSPENEEGEEETLMSDNQLLTTSNDVDVVENGEKFEADENANAVISQQSQLVMEIEGIISEVTEGKGEGLVQELKDEQPPTEALERQDFYEEVVNAIPSTLESEGGVPGCFEEAITEELQKIEQLIQNNFDRDDYEFSKSVVQAYSAESDDDSETRDDQDIFRTVKDDNENNNSPDVKTCSDETTILPPPAEPEKIEENVLPLPQPQSNVLSNGHQADEPHLYPYNEADANSVQDKAKEVSTSDGDSNVDVKTFSDEATILPSPVETETEKVERNVLLPPQPQSNILSNGHQQTDEPSYESDAKDAHSAQDKAEEVSTRDGDNNVDVKTCSDEATILPIPVETEKIERNVLLPPQLLPVEPHLDPYYEADANSDDERNTCCASLRKRGRSKAKSSSHSRKLSQGESPGRRMSLKKRISNALFKNH